MTRKYTIDVDVTLSGSITIEAHSKDEAKYVLKQQYTDWELYQAIKGFCYVVDTNVVSIEREVL